jgi:uncharacterized protein YhaN
MRFKSLSLLRYGAWAGRDLSLGDGSVDLHLVVGPNEAGKSTLLAAISDLLFGFEHRTSHDFRWAAGELRVAGCVEHAGQSLEIIRRKGRGETLTDPAGAVVPESALAALLGGVDREAFNRTFGLNHATLRQGGREILAGRDDAARIVLEASSGLSGLGDLVAQLDAQADDLFAPRASTKVVNVALRDRETALQKIRATAVTERDWQALVDAREIADREEADILARGAEIANRQSHLERIQRTRLILAKIDRRREELQPLEHLPRLPADAEQRRSDADKALAAAQATRDSRTADLGRVQAAIAALPARSALLDQATHLQALIDQRALYLSRVDALPLLQSERDTLVAGQHRHLADAGLAKDIVVPPKVARQRARAAIETASDLARERQSLSDARDRKVGDRDTAQARLSELASTEGLEHLRVVLDMAPRDGAQQVALAQKAAADAERLLSTALLELRPWTGSVDDLRTARVPPADTVAQFRQRLTELENSRDAAVSERDEATRRRAVAAAEVDRLIGDGEPLPTPEAVRTAREARDETVDALEASLEGRGGSPVRVDDVRVRIRDADTLVDRRTLEATRLAEHATQSAEVARQELLAAQATEKLQAIDVELAQSRTSWLELCQAAGFNEAIDPAQMTVWTAARDRALAAADTHHDACGRLQLKATEIQAHAETVRSALVGLGQGADANLDADGVVRVGLAVLAALVGVQSERSQLTDKIAALDGEIADIERELKAVPAASEAAAARARALAEIGLADDVDDLAALAAIDALDAVANDEPQRADFDRRIALTQQQISDFEAQVRSALDAAGWAIDGPVADLLSETARALTAGTQAEAELSRLTAEIERLTREIGKVDEAAGVARAELAQLAKAAGTTDATDLAETIAQAHRRDSLETELAELGDELNEAGGGVGEDTLRAQAAAIGFDEADAELAALQAERQALDQRLIEAAKASAAARQAEQAASAGTDAADALQEAEEAAATAIEAAERYARLKAASAVLQWAVGRYRATRQAPLLSRATEIMAQMTGGSLARLEIEYEGDMPHMVGVRPSGERVGVDGLSEGSADQLYLALRLASIEERVASHPIPFVCDDLLMTADDDRAALILDQLRQLSKRTQVLVFTHHRHLIDVARTALGEGGFVVHHLEPAPLTFEQEAVAAA